MRSHYWKAALVLSALVAVILLTPPRVLKDRAGSRAYAQPAAPAEPLGPEMSFGTADRELSADLRKKYRFNFTAIPLRQVVKSLESDLGIAIHIDKTALDMTGLDPNVPITLQCDDMSVAAGLNHMLRQVDLTWIPSKKNVIVTTIEEAEEQLMTSVFPIGDLIGPIEARKVEDAREMLCGVITTTIEPDSWEEYGGMGSLTCYGNDLAVRQTWQIQEQIRQLLAGLRQFAGDGTGPPHKAIRLGDPTYESMRAALDAPTTVDFEAAPLKEVVAYFAKLLKHTVLLDQGSLEVGGLDDSEPVSFRLRDAPGRETLHLLLKQRDLTFIVADEALVVTTVEEAEARLAICLYRVDDLLTHVGDEAVTMGEAMEGLTEVILTVVCPDSWEDVGGTGTVAHFSNPPTLVVAQTDNCHREIAQLLDNLRTTRGQIGHASANASRVQPDPFVLRVYQLAKTQGPVPDLDSDTLAMLIRQLVAPESWQLARGRKTVLLQTAPGRLIIRHKQSVHRQVRNLLTDLGVTVYKPGLVHGGFGGGAVGGGGLF